MRLRVKCANCGMIYERPQVASCPACKSNAADPVSTASKAVESVLQRSAPKELTDDLQTLVQRPMHRLED
jgi:uncharacterized OB-fold protein